MSLKALARAWNEFFFKPVSPVPIGIYRILFSLVVLADILLLRVHWLTWFGPRGLLTIQTMHQLEPGPRLNLFAILPQTDFWPEAMFWVLLISAICLLFGLFSRASSVIVFVLLASLDQRNLYITNAGDTLLRVSAFFLMFAPAGAVFSVDRLWRIWRGKENADIRPRVPWAQRMIQIELSLMYFMTFWNKSMGPAWVDGTAIFYVYHLDQFHRFPMPGILQDILMVRLETWFTLAVEFSLGVLVWFKELRYYILAAGVLLHLGLEYSMNVPMFQWIALSVYITFVDGADLARAWARIGARRPARLRQPVVVGFEPSVVGAARAAEMLKTFDVFGRLRLIPEPKRTALHVDSPKSLPPIVLNLWGAGKPSPEARTSATAANWVPQHSRENL